MNDLERVAEALLDGQVVILPTDTVYGLVACATNAAAVARIFELKQRPNDSAVAVLFADLAQVTHYVELNKAGHVLAKKLWPGPLTIVAKRIDQLAIAAGTKDTLGVRCPDDEFLCNVARRVGPLAASSANLHGQPPAANKQALQKMFNTVNVVVDDGPRHGAASTVLSLLGNEFEIIRHGPIAEAQISAALGESD